MDTNSMQHISMTQYHSNLGKICFPDGFEEHLQKLVYKYDSNFAARTEDGMLLGAMKESRVKSIVQQMRCFGWSEFKHPVEWDDPRLVAETPDSELQKRIHPLMTERNHIRLIMKENMVVGVALETAVWYYLSGEDYYYLSEDDCIFPYHGYVCASTSDNNGAGYKERNWYKYLICLPYNHNLW